MKIFHMLLVNLWKINLIVNGALIKYMKNNDNPIASVKIQQVTLKTKKNLKGYLI